MNAGRRSFQEAAKCKAMGMKARNSRHSSLRGLWAHPVHRGQDQAGPEVRRAGHSPRPLGRPRAYCVGRSA